MNASFPEKRLHRRHRVFVRGEIRTSRWIATRCSIHDVSPGGAKLIVSPVARLQELLQLHVAAWNLCVKAKVVWRDAERVGVRFVEPPPRLKAVIERVVRNRQPFDDIAP